LTLSQDINRFFVEKGDGDQLPKVEFGGTGGEEDGDLFEDQLEDALCVFKSGGGRETDILKENEGQLLFYVDLENETIVDKAVGMPGVQNDDRDELEQDIHGSKHPVLLNQYPLCRNHSLFLLFAEEGLPQVLSDELLLLLLQAFKLSSNPHLRIGYNSMGADCIANNLHFHLLAADLLFQDANQQSVFPIENAEKSLFFRSSLRHRSAEEVNMYSCGVRFGEVLGWPVRTLVLSPEVTNEGEASLEDAQEALAHAVGVVLNYLIDKNIPHNLLIADEGMTVYVIPRKFDLLIENVNFFTSFETLCGLVKCKVEAAFKGLKSDDFAKRVQGNISLKEAEFDQLKEDLIAKFMSEYEGEVINK